MHVKRRLAVSLFAAVFLTALARPAAADSLQARYAHSATLLPDGNILVVGGQSDDTPTLVAAEPVVRINEQSGSVKDANTAGYTNVSSHTATLLPNGDVLIAGGITGAPGGGANVSASVQLYNSQSDCWRAPIAFTKGTAGRYNHTATLLQNGDVLICGGMNNLNATLASCDIFHPAMPAPGGTLDLSNCATSGGTMDAAGVNLLIQRANHSSTLLSDGRVFLTGGLEPNPDPTGTTQRSLTPYMVTSEVYTPGNNTTTSAAPLSVARAYHRASLMGNGKVLVVGGYNGGNSGANLIANRGYLDTVEIYDPIADKMSPAAQLPMRLSSQAQVTQGDGRVVLYGGLGNVTTSYFNATAPIDSNPLDVLTGAYAAPLPGGTAMYENVTGTRIELPLTLTLTAPVDGVISDGFVLYSTPSISFPGGVAYLTPGSENPGTGALQGTTSRLNGDAVNSGIVGSTYVVVNIPANDGFYTAFPAAITGSIASMVDTGGVVPYNTSVVDWQPHGLCSSQNCTASTGLVCTAPGNPSGCGISSTFSGDAVISGLPIAFIGHNVNNATLAVTGGNVLITASGATIYTVSITAANATFQSYGAVTADLANNGQGKFTGRIQISNVVGSVSATTPTAQDSAAPYRLGGKPLGGLMGTLSFGVDGVDLSVPGSNFRVDIATVVIRQMVLGDEMAYTPKTNSWTVIAHGTERFGQTFTLEPSASIREFGGRNNQFAAQSVAPSIIERLPAFSNAGTLLTPRVNATSTLLPSGKILITGGSNGPNVLGMTELYDPLSQTTRKTGTMNVARDLHTATLLTNGRVLVTGGFVTTATSTGPSNTAEIYYPNTETWVLTSPLPYVADNHTATLLPDGNVLVAGGFANGVYLSKAAIYIATAAAWAPLRDMNDGAGTNITRALHTASMLTDGRVLIAGGVNQNGVLCGTVIFDPARIGTGNPWYKGPDIYDTTSTPVHDAVCAPMHSHAATNLKDGRVLLTGGTNGVSETNNAYIYTPAVAPGIGSWINSAYINGSVLNVKRFGHAAMLTPSGKVILMGGAQALGNAVADVETYDAAVSSFQIVGQLTGGRYNQSATLGTDGYIYEFGGNNGSTILGSIDRNYFTGVPDSASLGAPAGSRQSTIKALDVNPFQGFQGTGPGVVNVTGLNLQGFGESSGGGAASGNSSFNAPRLVLQAVSASGGTASQNAGDFMIDLSTRIYFPIDRNNWTLAKTTIQVQMPTGDTTHYSDGTFPGIALGGLMVPNGWYHLRDAVNAVYSNSLLVQVGPALPTKAPTGVQISNIGMSSITWTWTDPGGTGGNGWEVFSSSNGVFSTMTVLGQTQWGQFGLLPNSTMSIVVAAFNLSGDGPLGYSTTFYTYCSTPAFITAPPPVGVTTFTAVGFNQLTLNWDADNNTPGTYYEVYQSKDNFALDFSTPVPLISLNTSTSAVISFLQPNTQYWFKVRAFNGSLVPSGYSVTVTTKTLAPVNSLSGSPPSSPLYNPATTIQWSWADPGGVSYFKIYNATVPAGAPGQIIATVSAPPFFDVNLATDSARVVMVSAVSLAGEGPLSASATAFTLAAVPGVPGNAITNISTGSFTAFWTANGNPLAAQYAMVITDPFGNVFSTVNTNAFTAGFGSFLAPQAATPFSVKVSAINGQGTLSAFAVLGTTATLPDTPTSLAVINTTPISITLGWNTAGNSSTATYEVSYTTAVDFTNLGAIRKAVSFAQNFNGTSVLVSGLQTSTTYQFRVQAANTMGAVSAFGTPTVTTSPFNGGVPLGSLGGLVRHTLTTAISGTIGAGRQLNLTIPANAFPADTFITISTFDASGANSKCPSGVNIGVSITPNPYIQPLHPVFLQLGYTNAELGAVPTTQAALERVDPSGACVPLQTTLDTTNNLLTAQLNHFSQFQVANVTPSADPSQTVVFPNPFMPSQGNGFVTFKNMPASSRVRVFTVRGELVFDGTANGSGLATWGGTNRFGRAVASGVYVAVIEGNGAKQILKVVVLR